MLSRLTRAQVRLVVGPSLTFLQNVCSVGLFATYPTSYEALVRRGKLKAGACLLHPTVTPTVLIVLACTLGEWLLVLAAAGGVGMAAIQIGKGTNRSTHFNPANVITLKLGGSVQHSERGSIACASPSKFL